MWVRVRRSWFLPTRTLILILFLFFTFRPETVMCTSCGCDPCICECCPPTIPPDVWQDICDAKRAAAARCYAEKSAGLDAAVHEEEAQEATEELYKWLGGKETIGFTKDYRKKSATPKS